MAQTRRLYQLKISVTGADSPVWRRIMISANVTLRQAHGVIQKAMGWNDTHGYAFEQDGNVYGRLPADASYYVEDDSMFSLRWCLCEPGHELSYKYGHWTLSIVLEAIEPAEGRSPWRMIDRAGVAPSDEVASPPHGLNSSSLRTRGSIERPRAKPCVNGRSNRALMEHGAGITMFAMSAILDHPHKHPISAEEYLRMGEAGVFAPEARLELIDGEIIEMVPIHPPHAWRVKKLAELFFQRAGGRAIVSVQDPVVTSLHSVPQPDLALLKPRTDYYSQSHPGVSDVFLVVEVADTTAAFDLATKVPLYARGGIPEVWVVDVNERAIRVFRDPAEEGYRSTFAAQVGERVACAALHEVTVEVAELFPS